MPRRNKRQQTYAELAYKQNSIKEKGIKITLGMRKNRINIVENKIRNVNSKKAYQ